MDSKNPVNIFTLMYSKQRRVMIHYITSLSITNFTKNRNETRVFLENLTMGLSK